LLKKTIDWELEDPKDKPVGKLRGIRDEMERKAKKLINEVG